MSDTNAQPKSDETHNLFIEHLVKEVIKNDTKNEAKIALLEKIIYFLELYSDDVNLYRCCGNGCSAFSIEHGRHGNQRTNNYGGKLYRYICAYSTDRESYASRLIHACKDHQNDIPEEYWAEE